MSFIATEIFMVRPASFGFNQETAISNSFQQKNENLQQTKIRDVAQKEFDAFVQKLRSHQISVTVYQDSAMPEKPDAVFPNNWLVTMPGNLVFLFPMEAPNRRIEKQAGILEYLKTNFRINAIEDYSFYEGKNIFLEGTGSMIMDHAYKKMYACLSSRTNKELFLRFAAECRYTPIYFHACTPDGKAIYHTNVMMHVGSAYAVVCLDAIQVEEEKRNVITLLESTGKEIIPISIAQMHAFAGNMLQVSNTSDKKFTILSQAAFDILTNAQKASISRYSELVPIAIPTIEGIGGGSVRCMMAEIFLEKSANESPGFFPEAE